MKFEFDPRTCTMQPKVAPTDKINKSVANSAPQGEEWDSVKYLRESLAIASLDGYNHLCIQLNGQWRDCGIVTNLNEIYRQSRGPLVNFHNVWMRGTKIAKPKMNR